MTAIGPVSSFASNVRYADREQASKDVNYEPASYEKQKGDGGNASANSNGHKYLPPVSVRFMETLVNVRPIDMSTVKSTDISELPEDRYQDAISAHASVIEGYRTTLEHRYTDHSGPPAAFIGGRTETYARVMIGGSVVATIDNQGVATTDDVWSEKLRSIFNTDLGLGSGPQYAQALAETIAKAAGGRIEGARTAMTQAAFDALPSLSDWAPPLDRKAMENDPDYGEIAKWEASLADIRQRRSEYLVTHPEAGISLKAPYASVDADDASLPTSNPGLARTTAAYALHANARTVAGVEETFLEWSRKTPVERIRSAILDDIKLTEQQLQGLPEAERTAVERQIEEAIKRNYGLDGSGVPMNATGRDGARTAP